MKQQLEQHLKELRAEFETGQKPLAGFPAKIVDMLDEGNFLIVKVGLESSEV